MIYIYIPTIVLPFSTSFTVSQNMSCEKRKKSHSITNDQKSAMVDFLNSHSDLLKGKHSATFTQNIAAKQWQELTDLLNSIPGPIKDWKAWRRVCTVRLKFILKCIFMIDEIGGDIYVYI